MSTIDRPRSRLGLNVPYEWWPTPSMLKEIEAAGFAWVQLPSPPASVLDDLRNCLRHAGAIAANLAATSLEAVLHAPTDLLLGEPGSDRRFESVLAYAAECGAAQVVYHARATPDEPGSEERLRAERRSLGRAARLAERLGLVIAIENLAPTYPSPQTASAIPDALRVLAAGLDSDAVRLCLDLGHAHVIAGLRRTALTRLTDPVLGAVSLFHLHDNLGARWPGGSVDRHDLDPLRLDLHLPPGRGTLPWEQLTGRLDEHDAPLMLEVHHPHRPAPAKLMRETWSVLAPTSSRSPLELGS